MAWSSAPRPLSLVSVQQSLTFKMASVDARRRGGLGRVADRNVVGDVGDACGGPLPRSLEHAGLHKAIDGRYVGRSFSNGDEANARVHIAAQRLHPVAPVATANTSASIAASYAVR